MKMFGSWQKDKEPKAPELAAFGDSPAETNGERSSLGQNRKILVVDDNQIVLKAFEMKLKALSFQVLTAQDGATAVSLARQEKPDLIVLDINFPPEVGSSGLQWDGFNIMQWMQRFQEVATTPVIIITSGDPAKFKARALAAGAVAFFQKPINQDEFILGVRRALGQQRGAKPAAA